MTVWVLMGNDYPAAVFSDEKLANEAMERKKRENGEQRIYWRLYAFELNRS